jgi:serine/threonine-protein kinase
MDLVGSLVLETYVVEEEVGSGAMGTVYRGRHTRLRRHVAIKVMHDHLLGEPTLRERFRREGLVASKLGHANVVSVLDVGELADGKPVMIMEYAKGTSLADELNGPVPVPRMIALLTQILRGLDHAHGVGLVHRDLKPDNVILTTGDGGELVARIVDFGIAVLRGGDDEGPGGRLTGTGMIIGTPAYMAPEQAKAEPVDHRADLYAVGVIMYEMLAGITPFDGTAMEVAIAKTEKDPPPIAQRVPGIAVDRVLETFMRHLLVRDPARRAQTAAVAAQWLELYERDRLLAARELGVIDVERALAVISLPRR